MKKTIFIVASLVVVAALFAVSVITYNNHKATVAAKQTSQVQQLQAQLTLHDAVNAKDLEASNNNAAAINQKRLALCAVIKTTKAVYSPALCQ